MAQIENRIKMYNLEKCTQSSKEWTFTLQDRAGVLKLFCIYFSKYLSTIECYKLQQILYNRTILVDFGDPKRVATLSLINVGSINITFKVKPVFNNHPRDPKNVEVVDRWSLFRGSLYYKKSNWPSSWIFKTCVSAYGV